MTYEKLDIESNTRGEVLIDCEESEARAKTPEKEYTCNRDKFICDMCKTLGIILLSSYVITAGFKNRWFKKETMKDSKK